MTFSKQRKCGVCVTMEMTWLPWGYLTWWVASPVRWDGEEGVDNGHPSLEESGDHLQPLWAQQFEQLEGEMGREGRVTISSRKPKMQSPIAASIYPRQVYTHIQTCIHILWLTNTPKHSVSAKAEHLVITIRLVQNMLCRLASQT